MALFKFLGKKKQKEEEKKKIEPTREEQKQTKSEALSKASHFDSKIFIKPHIAEKSTSLNEKGVYVFEVGNKTNKMMVKQAIKEKYGVTPQKINIINLPAKKISFRGRKVIKSGFKKAMVFLKKGEKIEIS